ncbi:MAG: hypothetical protein R3B45_11705 [Bdellovibrionota bacterium]
MNIRNTLVSILFIGSLLSGTSAMAEHERCNVNRIKRLSQDLYYASNDFADAVRYERGYDRLYQDILDLALDFNYFNRSIDRRSSCYDIRSDWDVINQRALNFKRRWFRIHDRIGNRRMEREFDYVGNIYDTLSREVYYGGRR